MNTKKKKAFVPPTQKEIDDGAAMEAYLTMQRSIRPDATGHDFDRLQAASRVMGVVGDPVLQQAFSLEARMRAEYAFRNAGKPDKSA